VVGAWELRVIDTSKVVEEKTIAMVMRPTIINNLVVVKVPRVRSLVHLLRGRIDARAEAAVGHLHRSIVMAIMKVGLSAIIMAREMTLISVVIVTKLLIMNEAAKKASKRADGTIVARQVSSVQPRNNSRISLSRSLVKISSEIAIVIRSAGVKKIVTVSEKRIVKRSVFVNVSVDAIAVKSDTRKATKVKQ